MAKEEIILDLQVNQGDAISDLEKTKASIIGLKKEQADLTKAFKQGDITLEEYASDLVRVEGILKKQQNSYNTMQKSVTGVKTQLDKLIDSNKKISASFEDAANNINVAGVNIGQLGQKLTSFLNPVTAAVGIVGALGSAYARSTVGAKDLEFVTNQLSISLDLVSNSFAKLVNASTEDGEGFFTKLYNDIITGFGGGAAAAFTRQLALIREELEDLGREEISARADVSDRLADNQELLTKIQDSQTDYNEKLHLTGEIISNISKNEDELLSIKQRQLDLVIKQLSADPENEKLQEAQLLVQKEISNIQKDAERRRQAILRLESNITDQYNKQLEAQKKAQQDQKEERRKTLRSDVEKRGAGGSSISDLAAGTFGASETDFKKMAQKPIELAKETDQQIIDNKIAANKILNDLDNERLDATQGYLEAALILAQTFGSEGSAAYKGLAIAQTTIDTYRAATAALAPPPTGAGPLLGPALAAITIATGLANVAKITGIAAAGGADFTTKGPTMLLVGDNPGGRERVTVEPLSGRGKTKVFNGGVAMAGGGTMTIDGGASVAQSTAPINDRVAAMNAYKNMPNPVVSVKEITKTQSRVRVKERLASK